MVTSKDWEKDQQDKGNFDFLFCLNFFFFFTTNMYSIYNFFKLTLMLKGIPMVEGSPCKSRALGANF